MIRILRKIIRMARRLLCTIACLAVEGDNSIAPLVKYISERYLFKNVYKPPALIPESSQAKHKIVPDASSAISITSRYKSIYSIKLILKHSKTF